MITESDVAAARQAWGDGLIAIAQANDSGGIDAARQVASRVLDELYGYGFGPVLFKPTMASGEQTFRATKAGAVSYFVGHDPDYPLDHGFGLKGWRSVESETAAVFIDGDVALWMGRVHMTDHSGRVTTVDKSWGYSKSGDGTLRIVLHHSSLPYQP